VSSQTAFPSTVSNVSSPAGSFNSGGTAWTNITNMEATDGSLATCNPGSGNDTQGAQCEDFGFSTSGTINGVQVLLDAKSSSGTHQPTTLMFQLIKSGSLTGSDKTDTSESLTTTLQTFTYGSTSDVWSATVASSDVNGSTYGVMFQGQDWTGTSTLSVDSISQTVTYTASGGGPGTPTGLMVTTDSSNPTGGLNLAWNTVSGSPEYVYVQRAATIAALPGGWNSLNSIAQLAGTATSYTDTSSLSAGTEYAYELIAESSSGGFGSDCAGVAYATEPDAPGSLSATPGSATDISLSWTAPSIGSTISIANYYLYYRVHGSGSFTQVNVGTSTSYDLTGLSPGTSYDFEIQAVIESNNGDWSGTLAGQVSSIVTASTLAVDVPIPLGPAGFMGIGACPFGVTNQMRRPRVEGVRFRYV